MWWARAPEARAKSSATRTARRRPSCGHRTPARGPQGGQLVRPLPPLRHRRRRHSHRRRQGCPKRTLAILFRTSQSANKKNIYLVTRAFDTNPKIMSQIQTVKHICCDINIAAWTKDDRWLNGDKNATREYQWQVKTGGDRGVGGRGDETVVNTVV